MLEFLQKHVGLYKDSIFVSKAHFDVLKEYAKILQKLFPFKSYKFSNLDRCILETFYII